MQHTGNATGRKYWVIKSREKNNKNQWLEAKATLIQIRH